MDSWAVPLWPPDRGYLPFTHPPGHFIALGLAGKLFGVDYAAQLAAVGSAGRGLASSWVPGRGDLATGELISPPFTIDRERMSVLVGGGAGHATSVQLLVDGEVAFEATGSGSLVMMPVVWDVRSLRGRTAQIAILDHDQNLGGHILVDQIELFN